MNVFSADGWVQEIAALVLVAIAALYTIRHLTGWPRLRRRAPAADTPDTVQLGGRLSRGLKQAEKKRKRSGVAS